MNSQMLAGIKPITARSKTDTHPHIIIQTRQMFMQTGDYINIFAQTFQTLHSPQSDPLDSPTKPLAAFHLRF